MATSANDIGIFSGRTTLIGIGKFKDEIEGEMFKGYIQH